MYEHTHTPTAACVEERVCSYLIRALAQWEARGIIACVMCKKETGSHLDNQNIK
jgi:hypothetical protein